MRLSKRIPELPTKEEAILECALTLFSTGGYKATSLRDMASVLGINAATLYHYFDSKDQILFRLQHDGMQILLTRAEEAIQRTSAQPVANQMVALVEAHFRYHLAHHRRARLHVQEFRSLQPESRRFIRSMMKNYERYFTEAVERGIATNEFGVNFPKLTAFAILGVGAHLSNWYHPHGAATDDEIVRAGVEFIMTGLRGPHLGRRD